MLNKCQHNWKHYVKLFDRSWAIIYLAYLLVAVRSGCSKVPANDWRHKDPSDHVHTKGCTTAWSPLCPQGRPDSRVSSANLWRHKTMRMSHKKLENVLCTFSVVELEFSRVQPFTSSIQAWTYKIHNWSR
jgi:hypothetical protein